MGDDLICPLCRKHSSNKKAHIRHTSYCRQKAKSPLRSRKRSCLACIKAKTHCDAATSLHCSNCRRKGIECRLEGSLQGDKLITTSPDSIPIPELDGLSGSDALSFSQIDTLLTDWDDGLIGDTTTDGSRATALSKADPVVMRQASQLPISGLREQAVASIPASKGAFDRWLAGTPVVYQWNSMNFYNLGPQLSLQPVKAFAPRGSTWGHSSLLGKYMAQTVGKYPSMLLSDKSLPPFIHYQCMMSSRQIASANGPGPLFRCVAIVELWRSKTPNNASYLWKILRSEQERLMQEMSEYDDLSAVNALQAVTIYFLLRGSSRDEEGTDFDIPLIQTMSQLMWRVKDIITAYCDPALPVRPGVCDWVMAESLRRTIATLFIIELLFDISPGMINRRCNSLALWSEMLLPCSQYLWEAETQAEWAQRYDLLGDERPYYGELLRHDNLVYARSSLLDQWMANADDFGKLVINIASVAEVAC